MIRTIIIEDEKPAAQRLEHLLTELDADLQIVARLESVKASRSWLLQNDHPELIMLDIQLADGSSFDIFRDLEVDSHVIFTTAYDQYAIKAFELNSVDYLLKPIDERKLGKAIEKFLRLRKPGSQQDLQSLIRAIESSGKTYKERFAVNAGSSIRSIESSSVAFFYSMQKSQFLCTMEGRHYPVDHSLDALSDLLDPGIFFRINRKYLVNFHAIGRIRVLSRSRVSLEMSTGTDETLLVSTARTHQFRKWLDR